MELKVTFKNWQQAEAYYATQRNQCFSGGYNNGKSYILCLKALTLLLTYSNYRVIIARQVYSDLKRTTMQTFLAMCPTELIQSHNEQDGLTQLVNGSLIYWMHLDHVDENSLRGIEPNSIFIDQGEEVLEAVFLALDSRVGRWAGAVVPLELLNKFPQWPRKDGRPIPPSYMFIACNPDTEFHFIYRKYHPDSLEKDPGYFFVEGQWDRNLGSEESYDEALKRDPEWVNKFVRGIWGSSSAAIHKVRPEILIPGGTLINGIPILQYIKEKGALTRVMDHGNSAPTCCLWFAAILGVYICYREYYLANERISFHRNEISNLSAGESYESDYCDPHCFDKASQAKGGLYSVADEYKDMDLEAPPIYWKKADNNEFATRNRINELLTPSERYKHPLTKIGPAAGLYFISNGPNFPKEAVRQLGAQRKKILGTYDGKTLYSEDRDDSITDHAYDCVRYFVAMHGTQPKVQMKKPPRNSFAYYQAVLKQQLYRDQQIMEISR